MRIISKFHDYYDSIAHLGDYDDSFIFFRKNEFLLYEIEGFSWSSNYLKEDRHERSALIGNNNLGFISNLIIFCGKLYIGFTDYENQKQIWNPTFKINKKSCYWGIYNKFNELQKALKKDYTELHRKYQSPVLRICNLDDHEKGKRHLELNPCLQDKYINFASAVDPYTAYQQLERFVDMYLRKDTPELITLSNEDNLAKKGFDKFSFRKEKKEKKKKN